MKDILALSIVFVLLSVSSFGATEESTSLRDTQHVGVQLGALSLLMMETAKGFPLTEIHIPIGNKVFIGPQAQFIKDESFGTHSTHWTAGVKGYYFFGNSFETGPAISAVTEYGKTYGQGIQFDSATSLAKSVDYTNRFTHSAVYLTYFWYSKFTDLNASIKVLMNASVSAGVGYTHNSDCKNDAWCGSDGSHSGVVFSGEGWMTPDLAVRIDLSF